MSSLEYYPVRCAAVYIVRRKCPGFLGSPLLDVAILGRLAPCSLPISRAAFRPHRPLPFLFIALSMWAKLTRWDTIDETVSSVSPRQKLGDTKYMVGNQVLFVHLDGAS